MSEHFMNEAEIEKLTGFKAASKQCDVLTNHGIFFVKDRNGIPHVTWYSLNHPAHLRSDNVQHEEPDFTAME